MTLFEQAQRVKRGVALLDKKIPKWRDTLRRHRAQFDFANGDCCVLGTLEHYDKRMRQLKLKGASKDETDRFERACTRLGLDEQDDIAACGFAFSTPSDSTENDEEGRTLHDLWRAEFETATKK